MAAYCINELVNHHELYEIHFRDVGCPRFAKFYSDLGEHPSTRSAEKHAARLVNNAALCPHCFSDETNALVSSIAAITTIANT